jgi:outer membrane biosynthesis protein TonB
VPRPDRPPLHIGPLLVVVAAAAVSAGVVGISGALGQAQVPAPPDGVRPSEVAAASGDLVRPLPDALRPAATVVPSAVPAVPEMPSVLPSAPPRPTPKPTPRPTPKPTPKPTTVPVTTAPATTAPKAAATVWDRIAQCETGGDWARPESNGASGGLLFYKAAWAQYGGTQYAPIAAQATKAQQIAVAERVHAERGDYSAWPGCGDGL